MIQELFVAAGQYYAERFTENQIQEFLDNSDSISDQHSLQIALNIKNEKYGKQLSLVFE